MPIIKLSHTNGKCARKQQINGTEFMQTHYEVSTLKKVKHDVIYDICSPLPTQTNDGHGKLEE